MVEIQSKEVIDKISEELKIQPSMLIPRELAKLIQLVYNVNPDRSIQVAAGTATDVVAFTLHTTHATKDTFLTSVSLTVAKSVLSPSVLSFVQVFPFGKSNITLISLRSEPLIAGDGSLAISFPTPIRLERNSIINLGNTSATPSIDATASITFYEVDPQ